MDSRILGGNIHGMRLRVVPAAASDAGCSGCSRRTVLCGIAVTAASVLVGCPSDPMVDPDAGSSNAKMCGDNLCLDLNDPQNAALTMVDGSLVIAAPADRIIIVRSSTSVTQAISDVCTHLGCGVRYERVNKILVCPCHGSKYAVSAGCWSRC